MGELYLDKAELIELSSRISEGSATDEDIRRYNVLYRHFQAAAVVPMEIAEANLLEQGMIAEINQELFPPATLRLNFWIRRVAASVLLISALAAGFYFLNSKPEKMPLQAQVVPGGNKAVLTLANGKKIMLHGADGVIALGSDASVSNHSNGILSYENLHSASGNLGSNIMETPRGGIYQVRLADGTRVWLNSATKLTYPVVYAKAERVVELEGEAYFEVAKEPGRPFRVKSKGQLLEVLGTHFNLNAYADESVITTTLLEGSVSLSAAKERLILRPLQQASNNGTELSVHQVTDATEAVAWKNGYFQFEDEDLESVLRKISRWYDVDITFVGKPVNQKFNGSISRSKGIRKALEIIEATGNVKFKLEGRTLIVRI